MSLAGVRPPCRGLGFVLSSSCASSQKLDGTWFLFLLLGVHLNGELTPFADFPFSEDAWHPGGAARPCPTAVRQRPPKAPPNRGVVADLRVEAKPRAATSSEP